MSANERIEAIRKLYKSAEWLEDDYGQTLIDVENLGEVLKHAEALAAQVERLQRALVEARRRCNHLWLKSVPDSTPYDPIFQDYLERQLEPGDMPNDGSDDR